MRPLQSFDLPFLAARMYPSRVEKDEMSREAIENDMNGEIEEKKRRNWGIENYRERWRALMSIENEY